MNLPNKLTTLRVIMIPFFVFFLLWQNGENHTFRMIALALFIIASLTDLLDGKITEPQERPMLEPDFVFMLYPAKDLRTDPTYTYIKPRDEFQDIYVEWRVFFWNDGLTENFLTITLEREDIASLRDFLNSCKNDAGKV